MAAEAGLTILKQGGNAADAAVAIAAALNVIISIIIYDFNVYLFIFIQFYKLNINKVTQPTSTGEYLLKILEKTNKKMPEFRN